MIEQYIENKRRMNNYAKAANKTLKSSGMTLERFLVLRTLNDNVNCTVTELCELSAILAPSVSRMIADLEDDKFIKIKVSTDDARSKSLNLTTKAKRLVERYAPLVESAMEGAL